MKDGDLELGGGIYPIFGEIAQFDVECPRQEGNARAEIDVEEGTVNLIEAPHVAGNRERVMDGDTHG